MRLIVQDEADGSTESVAIQCLQSLEEALPHAIYWGYIAARAQQLGPPIADHK